MYYIFFLCVVACFAVSLVPRENADKADAAFTRFGLLSTAAADFFMVVLNRNAPALVFFILAQLTYTRRFSSLKTAFAAAVCAAVVFLGASLAPLDITLKLSPCYAVCISFAVFLSVIRYKKSRTRENFFACCGMTLFLLCDISVAVFNLARNPRLVKVFQYLIWVFYLPSQFFIAISVKKHKKTEQNKPFSRL